MGLARVRGPRRRVKLLPARKADLPHDDSAKNAARKRLTLRGAPYKIEGVLGAAQRAVLQFARIRKKAA
jgi:hypothetical protein